ncbi:unnamed protein product [Caenorhabditis brenneri]
MRNQKVKNTCSICLEPGDGFHFGAEACKACAAFFRRSVALKKTYQCRGDGYCNITINIRCMCRACRYTKCLEMGMNPAGVQQRQGSKTQSEPVPSTLTWFQSPLLVPTLPSNILEQIPLLAKMRANYQKLDNARLVIHKKEEQNLFEKRVPQPIDYKESVEQGMKDMTLAADWISWCFEDFVNLELLQKNILFRHFYTPFYMMEGAFLSHIHNRSDAVVLPSGDYIDMNRLETFYKNLEDAQPLSKKQIDDIFKPSYDMHRKCLILPMMSEKLDLFEFFALTTLLLWDTGLENLTDQTIETGKKNKDQIMKELAFYMKTVKSIEEPAVRVGSIVNLLPAAHKSTRRIQDDLEMTQVFKIYTPSQEFYNMVNGNF